MVHITPQIIENMVKRNGIYFVPENIKTAIEQNLETNNENEITEEYRNLVKIFQSYETVDAPIEVGYTNPLTLDAYTAYYLCRNIFIPAIGLRDLAFHPQFQNIPSPLRVLDLGSGTGAVTLGLLSMFSNKPLSQISLHITTTDCCTEALWRQIKIISKAGFNSSQIDHYTVDIKTNDCLEVIKKGSPYHLVFMANCLTEIQSNNAISLVERLPEVLGDKGAIIIAEAQRNYTKKLIRTLTKTVKNYGLNVYYPCRSDSCPYPFYYCWVWRYHEYEVPDIRVNGKLLQESPKSELLVTWLILTKQNISIYDTFSENLPELSWGPVSKEHGKDRSICNSRGIISFEDKGFFPIYKRGHIVGLSDKSEVKAHYKI